MTAAAASASMQEIVESSQRQAIRQALALHHDNWAAAARQLELDASNLHKLARRLGLKSVTHALAGPWACPASHAHGTF